MTAYTAWLDHVAVDVPGITKEFAVDAIRNAVIDFCEKSRLYKYEPAAINVVASQASYPLIAGGALPADTALWDVLYAAHDGVEIYPKGKAELDGLVTDWRLSTTTGVPGYYMLGVDRASIRLVTTPADSLAGGLTLELALKPLRASTTCPDWILENHIDAIKHGAKWKLFSMQKKPWANAQLALYHMQEFDIACGQGDIMAGRDNTRAPLRTTPQR
jgi:hypothetical protein